MNTANILLFCNNATLSADIIHAFTAIGHTILKSGDNAQNISHCIVVVFDEKDLHLLMDARSLGIKTLQVVHYSLADKVQKIDVASLTKTILVGDLIGESIIPEFANSAKVVGKIAAKNQIVAPSSGIIVIDKQSLFQVMQRELFSYTVSAIFFFGYRLDPTELIYLLRQKYPNLSLSTDLDEIFFPLPSISYTFVEKKCDIEILFNSIPQQSKHTKKSRAKMSFKLGTNLRLERIVLFFAVFFVLPIVVATIGLLVGVVGYLNIKSGSIPYAKQTFYLSSKINNVSVWTLGVYRNIPIVGYPYKYPLSGLESYGDLLEIADSVFTLRELSDHMVNGVMGKEHYSVNTVAGQLSVELDALYKQMESLESVLENKETFMPKKAYILSKVREYKKFVYPARELARQLPDIIGGQTQRTYLVLFQNNMELRPTGGFIGSYALVSFEKGKMKTPEVFDVYTADGQLKGFVKPPKPISTYLNEPKWYLRDSNWDPDFTTSAKTAEWFLEKSMDQKVDGVIAIDLHTIESILKAVGPINLVDFQNEEITKDNFYQKIQSQVETNFFPGSTRKASYLSGILSGLLNQFSDISAKEFKVLLKEIFQQLESRNIQLALHIGNDIANTLSLIGWDGGFEIPECDGVNCQPNWMGIVEANVGVNKANYFVKRRMAVGVTAGAGKLTHKLRLELSNSALPQASYAEHKYKSYIRVLVPKDSNPIGEYELSTFDNREELGQLIEVAPGATKIVEFSWEVPHNLNFKSNGSMPFFIRKQAGLDPYPGSVEVAIPELSLTGEQVLLYNTDLAEDFNTVITW